jgi:Transposase IS116/IS110/IS902 family
LQSTKFSFQTSSKGKKPSRNAPNCDLRSHLYRISGVDFTQIDGLEALTVQAIIAEVGLDATRFPTSKHFTSWLGICPGSKISGGKILSSKTRKVVNRASNSFRIAAQSLAHSQTALGGFYRRIRSHSGAPIAITAIAPSKHGFFTTCGRLVKILLMLALMLTSNNTNNGSSNSSSNVPSKWASI